MRKGNARPLTAGPVPKRYETLPRIWRPKTSVYRKNIQDVEEMDNGDSEHSSDEEEYDSDSTVSQSDSGPRTRPGERHFSAESSSTQILSNIKSEEDLEYDGQILHDLTTQATPQGFSLDTIGCHFGEVPMQYATKRMEIKEPENCHCLANLVHYESNAFGPWKSTCRHRIHRQKTQTEQRNVNSKMSQVPNLYQRLNRNSSKNYIYPFCHFENRGKYIQQYRDLYSSVGKFKKALEFPKENKIPNPLPDPYLKRLRSNVCSIAENFDVFAILAVEKESSEKEELEAAGDMYKSMTVNDRGKNLNLAPVRDSPPLGISPQQFQGKLINKNFMPFNQYLNLVIPKTTLHRTNIQLNLDNPKDSWTPRFESKRNPSKHSHRRSESVDSHLKSSKHHASSQSSSRRSSGTNRTSELRLERASTSADGVKIKKESGYIIPPPPTISQNTSILTKRKTQIQKTKCVSQIRAMLSDLDDCKGKLDRTCRRLENGKLGPEAKQDRVIPATKPFGVEGQTCRTEDQLSIIHRLRKEKERTLRVSTVN